MAFLFHYQTKINEFLFKNQSLSWAGSYAPCGVFHKQKNGSTAAEIQSVLHGTIIDSATRYPVQGATVQIAGTTHAVATNSAGRFEFVTGQRLPLLLEVSYVGYRPVRLEIDKNDVIIALPENQNRLNDVVVVGYGTQKRKDLVGSLSVVKTGEVKSIPGGSFDQQLQEHGGGCAGQRRQRHPGTGSVYQGQGHYLDLCE